MPLETDEYREEERKDICTVEYSTVQYRKCMLTMLTCEWRNKPATQL